MISRCLGFIAYRRLARLEHGIALLRTVSPPGQPHLHTASRPLWHRHADRLFPTRSHVYACMAVCMTMRSARF